MSGKTLIGIVVVGGAIAATGFASCTPNAPAQKAKPEAAKTLVAHDPVIVVTGDIACTRGDSGTGAQKCAYRDWKDASGVTHPGTGTLASSLNPDYIILLGDLQYPNGNSADFLDSPADAFGTFTPWWWNNGTLTPAKMFPVPGNHEYRTTAAGGYFARFGSAGSRTVPPGDPDEGFYAYDIPTTGSTWRAIALNSGPCTELTADGSPFDSTDSTAARAYRSASRCDSSSAQTAWLNSELAANHRFCTLAYWHHNDMSGEGSGAGDGTGVQWFRTLANATNQADIVLWGHQHNIEEFSPMRCTSTSCTADSTGAKPFIVGLGGINSSGGCTVGSTCAANTLFSFSPGSDLSKYAVLKLVLHSTSYDYSFIANDGTVLRSGTGTCHDPAPPPSGSITGKVTNFQTGAAISGANVSYTGGSTTSDASGNYTLANVPAGSTDITAVATGYLSRTFTVAVSGTTTQDAPLSTAGKIVGNVTGNGTALAGATVAISGGQITTNQSVTTDSTGHYDEQWVPIGSYTVTCSAPGLGSQTIPTTVTTGTTSTVNCALTTTCNEQPVITEPHDGESADIGPAINLHVSAGSCVTTMKVYLDNVEVQTISGNVSPVPPATTNWIGNYSEGVQHSLVVVGFNSDAGTASTTVHFTWP